ncbi:putative abortive infection phage resistance protein [Dehalococcoides mccartyi]|uniref:Putative abortive infection phage resistance protein n=1 Tax=Dehalococcoides mccartyi TaxID=61435 RepID=A0A328EN18_9CHLR|nr:putative abortive infection phage resistance protein [Dehalococcoides mccartyi]
MNKGIQETLRNSPERFGLYNNGITLVVADFQAQDDETMELVDPYVVNGCQTTRTIWEVCHQRLEAGGTGENSDLKEWRDRAASGVVITKIVKVGTNADELIQFITRYTNSQNAVREKDFLALTSDFRTWAREMANKYNIFLETQREGGTHRELYKSRDQTSSSSASGPTHLISLKFSGPGGWANAVLHLARTPHSYQTVLCSNVSSMQRKTVVSRSAWMTFTLLSYCSGLLMSLSSVVVPPKHLADRRVFFFTWLPLTYLRT